MLQSNLSQPDEVTPQQPQPSFEDDNTFKAKKVHNNHHPDHRINSWYHFSKFEKLIIMGILVTIVAMSILLLTAKINLSNSQRHLQEVNNNITQIHNTNSNLNQEIIELQNSGRLQKIAAKENLSLNNKNIRNVGK